MKSKYLWMIVLIASTMLLSLAIGPKGVSATDYGPRSDYSLFFYADENLLYTALKAGAIDAMMWEMSSTQVADSQFDENMSTMSVPRYDLRAWSLNTNYTITDQVTFRNPMSDISFREAVHHCTDRDYYTQVICSGLATPLWVAVTANCQPQGWYNDTTVAWLQANLGYSITQAKAALTAGNWIDTDGNGYVNYPTGWPGKPGNPDLVPIILVRRIDDAKRSGAMDHLTLQLNASGIPTNVIDAPSAGDAATRVMIGKNYHIYCAGWSLGRYPTSFWGWFNRVNWIDGANSANYHTGYNVDGSAWYPDLDAESDALFAPANLPAAKIAAQNCQYLTHQKYMLFIPTWCTRSFYCYKNLLGTVNEQGYGLEYTNSYFPLNAFRIDNPSLPIRVGIKNPPTTMNIITASWVWEVSIFSRFMESFIDLTPYNVIRDSPWCAQDWESGTWVDPDTGTTKSKVTYYLRKGMNWVAPVNGSTLAPRDARDHPFSCWYWDSVGSAGWVYGGYRDIKYAVVENNYKITFYADAANYWMWLNPWGRDLYPAAWKVTPLTTLETKTYVVGTNLTTPGYISTPTRAIGTPVEIVSMTYDTGSGPVAMTPDTTPYLGTHTGDYALTGGTSTGPRMRIFTTLPGGAVVTVQYYARGDYSGFYAGGKAWENQMISSAPFYMTSLNTGLGGWATFKANRNHWLERPPVGEIDYYWYFIGDDTVPKPRSGYYMVDILDVTKCTAAYDSTGNGSPTGRSPSGNWQPGVDIAKAAFTVDIFDVVTITGKYETEWGTPIP